MGRRILAVIAGLFAGFLIVALVEALSPLLFTMPAGLNPKNPESIRQYAEQIPAGSLVVVLLAHALGSFGGGWLAALVARVKPVQHALIVGALVMIAGIVNLVIIPHPLWFSILDVLVYMPSAYLGGTMVTSTSKPSET